MKKQEKSLCKNRILGEWRTSIIGFIILCFSGYAVATGKASLSELKDMGGWLLSAGLLIRAKDSIIGVKNEDNE